MSRPRKPRPIAQAPNFKDGTQLKEFILNNGLHILVIKFPDGSGAVYKKIRYKGKASAEFVPVKRQKDYLKMLDIKFKDGASTYEMIKQVMG